MSKLTDLLYITENKKKETVEEAIIGRLKDRVGDKFHHWTVLSLIKKIRVSSKSSSLWLCVCDCGYEKQIRSNHLSGRPRICASCGAGKTVREKKHGACGTKIYNSWLAMRQRCLNKKTAGYKGYGGRGISFCSQWDEFIRFRDDMGIPPSDTHTLDRIDVNGNYNKENCRWATPLEQANNRGNNRIIEFRGVSMTASQWARKVGISKEGFLHRINVGWLLEDAMNPGNFTGVNHLKDRR